MTSSPTAIIAEQVLLYDRSLLRRINSVLDEDDNGAPVVIPANLFSAASDPTDEAVSDLWNRYLSDLTCDDTGRELLRTLIKDKRAVSNDNN